MKYTIMAATAALVLAAAATTQAAGLKVSIGIRETGGAGPVFANGGSTGGIEWVNRDGQTLTADGTWQLFTFTPATDPLLAFAGATANSVLEPGLEWAVLEHIRILNSDGITQPIRVWIDQVTNATAAGATVEGFESHAPGTEVMFQEPRFSGSTSAFLALTPNTAAVTNSMAFAGTNSYQVDFQYIDATPTNWVRLTTFGATQVPNPLIRVVEPGAPAPTVSFYAKAVVIPEPGTAALLAVACVAATAVRRRAA